MVKYQKSELILKGSLRQNSPDEAYQLFTHTIKNFPKALKINIKDLEFVNSCGLMALARLITHCIKKNITVTFSYRADDKHQKSIVAIYTAIQKSFKRESNAE